MTSPKKPSVSVVIPTYNRAYCIEQTLETVLKQTYADYEIIVVDDGSSDHTFELMKRYADKVRYIYQPNAGVSAARNTGIREAQADWIAFLDSDDEWFPEKLKLQMYDLNANPGAIAHMVDVLISDQKEFNNTLLELRGMKAEFSHTPYREHPLCDVLTCSFFPSSWVVSRKAIEAAGYFNPSMRINEDTDLLSRVALEGAFLVNCYVGTNLRRKPGGSGALSDLHQTSLQESLKNIITMYENLNTSNKLTEKESRYVKKELAASYIELAIATGKNKKTLSYYNLLTDSLKCDASAFGLAKVLALLLLGIRGFETIRTLKSTHKKTLRRSNLEV